MILNNGRSSRTLLLALSLLLLAGCRGKTAAQAEKAIEKAVRQEAKVAPRVEREGYVKKAADVALDLGKDKAVDLAKDALKEYAKPPVPPKPTTQPAGQPYRPVAPPRERFPYLPSSVEPLAGARPVVDYEYDVYALANNYGGFSFYRGNGTPVGFSAWHEPSRTLHYFDIFGYRLK